MLTIAAILGGGAVAPAFPAPEPPVPVCMPLGFDVQPLLVAQNLAAKMFAAIGVKLEWRRERGLCAEGDIIITLSYQTPDDQIPGAWAYALPFEGTHIVVFWDRIRRKTLAARAPILLAHVLAHEITHTLEGVVRHSASGLMKETWTSADYFEMGRQPLPFAPVDLVLIQRGLQARQASVASQPQASK